MKNERFFAFILNFAWLIHLEMCMLDYSTDTVPTKY